MRIDVLTVFPELFFPFRRIGVLGRAVTEGRLILDVHDLRAWATNRHLTIDDEPYGGGPGMVIQAPPVLAAVRDVEARAPEAAHRIHLSPRGRPFDRSVARELAGRERLLLLCGRYEGFDERVDQILRPDVLSIGDVVLGGGETAAMVVIEAVSRLLPGVVGDPRSVAEDSFEAGLLDHPSYTRPPEVEGHGVPPVLLSGDHAAIDRWRLERSVAATVTRRPDLLKREWPRLAADVRELIARLDPDLADAAARAHPDSGDPR